MRSRLPRRAFIRSAREGIAVSRTKAIDALPALSREGRVDFRHPILAPGAPLIGWV